MPSQNEIPVSRPNRSVLLSRFIWASGIECSFIPHLGVDQFEWTQHTRFWRKDFKRAKEEIGCTHLRYAFPWHALEPARGKFNWSLADERIEEANRLGLELALDVMHFGTPLWLSQAVGDPEFPEALESFAHAMVSRYSSSVQMWCPFNEPLVSALFSGDFGFWPPHARKWRGYMPVLSRIIQGVSRGIRAIRSAMPEATVLLCDAAEHFSTRDDALKTEVQRRNLRRFLGLDLLTGRVDRHHPLHSWVNSYGMSDLDLEWFRINPQSPDILGLDYYPHSDWALEMHGKTVRQRRADRPYGFYGVGEDYWQRYGIPLMLTETSIEGEPINREIWLENILDDIKSLREEGTPVLGIVWWPLVDHVDWDGALTHRVGKIHEVGLFHLKRQHDGTLNRVPSPMAEHYRKAIAEGDARVGKLAEISLPSAEATDEQLPPIGQWMQPTTPAAAPGTDAVSKPPQAQSSLAALNRNGDGNKTNATESATTSPAADAAPGIGADPLLRDTVATPVNSSRRSDRYGIVVFSHLRWGFVWQRPQQFLSRFAKNHPILFIEEPFFDLAEGSEPRLDFHGVMPNVTVACPHCPPKMAKDKSLPTLLRKWTAQAIARMNESRGEFENPLHWYYSPMDSAWSLGHFPARGVVYDCMDELSQFTGAPKALVANEARLMEHADIVFTGGYKLGEKKRQQHHNVHTFGCGVEFNHFNRAQDEETTIPPDVDFMDRPILGWMGVVDERVDYALVGEMARMRPDWSFAMVGPVVKIDPNLLPHAPNLYWLGGRDYKQLPHYCRAFDVNMMCFALNASTEFINPTKGLEYMATGKPIVSTHVRDVVQQWSDIVYLAKGAEDFVRQTELALREPDPDRLRRGLELARKNSWESTVSTMERLINEAVGTPTRSTPRATPLPEVDLEYAFQATQGS